MTPEEERRRTVALCGWESIPGAIRNHVVLLGRQRARLGRDDALREQILMLARQGRSRDADALSRDLLAEHEREAINADIRSLPGEIGVLRGEMDALEREAEPLFLSAEVASQLRAEWDAYLADEAQRDEKQMADCCDYCRRALAPAELLASYCTPCLLAGRDLEPRKVPA